MILNLPFIDKGFLKNHSRGRLKDFRKSFTGAKREITQNVAQYLKSREITDNGRVIQYGGLGSDQSVENLQNNVFPDVISTICFKHGW